MTTQGDTARTAADVLRAARELISTPEKWTQKAYARNADGLGVIKHDARAVCFCSSGALYITQGWEETGALKYLNRAMGGLIADFNDYHTHAEVMERWDRAIALADKEKSA